MNKILLRVASNLEKVAAVSGVWYPKDYNNILPSYEVPINITCPDITSDMNAVTKEVYKTLGELVDLFHEFVFTLKGGLYPKKRSMFEAKWEVIKSKFKKTITLSSDDIENKLDAVARNDYKYIARIGEIFSDLGSADGLMDVLTISSRTFFKFQKLYGSDYVNEFIKAREDYTNNTSKWENMGIISFEDYIDYLVTDLQENSMTNEDLTENKSIFS